MEASPSAPDDKPPRPRSLLSSTARRSLFPCPSSHRLVLCLLLIDHLRVTPCSSCPVSTRRHGASMKTNVTPRRHDAGSVFQPKSICLQVTRTDSSSNGRQRKYKGRKCGWSHFLIVTIRIHNYYYKVKLSESTNKMQQQKRARSRWFPRIRPRSLLLALINTVGVCGTEATARVLTGRRKRLMDACSAESLLARAGSGPTRATPLIILTLSVFCSV